MNAHRIFVFGSNRAGRHGKGSALEARRRFGAVVGVGEGPTGQSYAIPTKSESLQILPLSEIRSAVLRFLDYARQHPEVEFDVVDIGCGLAGYKPSVIAPMFEGHPANVHFLGDIGALLE